jgi:peptidoglycan/LPS O-acetylase OafA/YrhL
VTKPDLSVHVAEPTDYLRQLDGLRAVAVGGVVWQHWLSPTFQFGSTWGVRGVWLFFVISGFLITGILLRCRNDEGLRDFSRLWSIRQFYIRRFLRIFPLYYATLAVAALLDAPHVRDDIGWHAAYLTNVYAMIVNAHVQPAAHFWSLAVEEQFYLLWPWLIVFVPRRWLLPMVVASIALGPAFRAAAPLLFPGNDKTAMATPACFDALGAGALLSCVAYVNRKRDPLAGIKCGRRMLAVGLPLAAVFAIWSRLATPSAAHWIEVAEPTALALVFGWAVVQSARGFPGPIGWLLGAGPVVYLGRISYGIYITHPFIEAGVGAVARQTHSLAWLESNSLARAAVMFAVMLAVTSLSWFAFESPINRLKRHFPYRAGRPAMK